MISMFILTSISVAKRPITYKKEDIIVIIKNFLSASFLEKLRFINIGAKIRRNINGMKKNKACIIQAIIASKNVPINVKRNILGRNAMTS